VTALVCSTAVKFPHLVSAASRGHDDIVEIGEIPDEQLFSGHRFSMAPAVHHWLSAARLIEWILDMQAKAFEQFQRCDTGVQLKGIHVARHEQRYAAISGRLF
jgi:hypothetical protein